MQAMIEALEKRVIARASFKGHLDTYRFCDNVRSVMPSCPDVLLGCHALPSHPCEGA